jgi:hypothetical protein
LKRRRWQPRFVSSLPADYFFSCDSTLQPADLMAILNGRSNPATAASSKAAPVAKGKASKASGKV